MLFGMDIFGHVDLTEWALADFSFDYKAVCDWSVSLHLIDIAKINYNHNEVKNDKCVKNA